MHFNNFISYYTVIKIYEKLRFYLEINFPSLIKNLQYKKSVVTLRSYIFFSLFLLEAYHKRLSDSFFVSTRNIIQQVVISALVDIL